MTARQVFEATQIELSKVQAPNLKLYEFNYLFNKAINQYINKVYNVHDINQQTTDDLRVLRSTAFLTPTKVQINGGTNKAFATQGTATNPNYAATRQEFTANQNLGEMYGAATSPLSRTYSQIQSLHGATYEVDMPMDYLHMLNCVCIYYVAKTKDCWDAGSYIEVPALRLTADSWSQIVTDVYNRPSPMRPYYYIHNLNKVGNDLPSGINDKFHTYGGSMAEGTDKGESNFSRTFTLSDGKTEIDLVEKQSAARIGNASNVRCEIRYGKDDSLFQLVEVQVDYVKVPQHIRLTQEQIDLTEDTSQIMEFPDYVNQEIINELVHLVMLRTNDPQLGNHMQMTQTIARPTGQQQQQTAPQG